MGSIEVKVKKLDGELSRYKEQMSKLRDGPGKVLIRLVLVSLATLNVSSLIERHTTAGAAHAETETDVRVAARAAHAADVQYGVGRARDGEPAQHHGNCGRHEAGEQRAAETIWED